MVRDIEQEFMPDAVKGTKIYDPGDNPREKDIRSRLKALWKKKYNY
ncbi:MAG: hypothetical protein JEZ03_01405 [Bacteroidales bacterium]|nr:hypothetical protein [Bacteroidales bacterium]